MNAIVLIFLLFVAVVFTFKSYRAAVVTALVIDIIRDPLRKLTPDQPVLITLLGAMVWAWFLFWIITTKRHRMKLMFLRWPMLRRAYGMLLVALCLASIVGLGFYSGTLVLVGLGWISYGAPAVALAAGYEFFGTQNRLIFFMRAFALLNGIAVSSAFLEFAGVESQLFGGIDYTWIRYSEGKTLNLMSGIYRSPDILGLHAALACVFALIVYRESHGWDRYFWPGIAAIAFAALVVAGRRKMIGIPIVFMAAQYILAKRAGMQTHMNKSLLPVLVAATATSVVAYGFGVVDIESGYLSYASSTVTESYDRVDKYMIGGSAESVRSLGILGAGLGTGTQGKYYTGLKTSRASRGWQEDGVSKLFLELGVAGVILSVWALVLVALTFRQAILFRATWIKTKRLQVAVAAASAGAFASYLVAHQHFSGDPSLSVICAMLPGSILSFADAEHR